MHKFVTVLSAVTILIFSWHAQAATGIWRDVSPPQPGAKAAARVSLFQANDQALRSALLSAPHETSGRLDHQVPIPMPDGSLVLFSVQESPIMAPELAAKYPQIRTFKVFGVDDMSASGRIDITPLGFHGMIETSAGRVFIDPEDFRLQDHIYRTRFGAGQPRAGFSCGVVHEPSATGASSITGLKTANRVSGSLLQYDLAVAVTLEYHQYFGDIVANTTGAINTTINRVNFVYERDHGIRLLLVANNDDIYETSESGLLDNEDNFQLLGQVNSWIDTRLTGGDGAYDIGHIFSRPTLLNSGGVANIGAVCDSNRKAGGVSGLSGPSGDAFDIDLVAHEIGHQFDAEHSFNGATSMSCENNRNASTAYEPGSGSSIMSYAGICAGENLQTSSDVSFHAGSIAQVDAFTAGDGNCYDLIPTAIPGNNDPVITAIANTTIPANTPFLLGDPEGPPAATDVDFDMLQYRWDQIDAGCPTDAASFGTDIGSNALFRGYEPRADAWRNFPALGTQLQRRFDKAEVLPCHNRALDFRLTATDGRSGQDFEDVRVSVDAGAGPFEITNLDPAPPIVAGTAFPVNWDVAGTNLAPINCATVDIDLIDFSPGYGSYSRYPLGTRANTGSTLVTVNPANSQHMNARIRIKCSDNIFYDISDADLTVTAVGAPVAMGDTDFTTQFYANIGITGFTAPACGPIVDCSPPPPDDDRTANGDASSFGYGWLLLLGGLAALRRTRPGQG